MYLGINQPYGKPKSPSTCPTVTKVLDYHHALEGRDNVCHSLRTFLPSGLCEDSGNRFGATHASYKPANLTSTIIIINLPRLEATTFWQRQQVFTYPAGAQ
jgi:hypothetical protein